MRTPRTEPAQVATGFGPRLSVITRVRANHAALAPRGGATRAGDANLRTHASEPTPLEVALFSRLKP